MITSKDNEKLKLIRKLAERKHREREGLFVAEGEDLVEAAEAAGARARVRAPRRRRRRARAARLGLDARLRDPGDRRLPAGLGRRRARRCGCYLHGVGDPGNVGTIVRTAHALAGRRGRRRPRLRRPVRAQGRAREHGLDLRPPAAAGRGRRRWRRPWSASSRTAARRPTTSRSAGSASAASARACSAEVAGACDRLWTIPLRRRGRVAERGRGGGRRHRTDIVGRPDDRADRQPA